MTDKLGMSPLQVIFMLGLIPGAACDNYTIGNFIAASVLAFVFLIIVLGMLIVAFWWDKWFDSYQKTNGRVKVTRAWLDRRKVENNNSVTEAEKYEMNSVNHKRHKEMEGVHSTFVCNNEAADWIQEMNTGGHFEEKTKVMDLEEEDHDEPLIITEVLRESTGHSQVKGGEGLTSL